MDIPLFDPDALAPVEDVERVVFRVPTATWSMAFRRPVLPLAFGVAQFWETHGYCDYSREKILPNGHVDLIFNLGGPHATLAAEDLREDGCFRIAWLSGIHDRAIIAAPTYDTVRYGSLMVGVTLTPVGARRILGIGGDSFASRVVELSDVLDPVAVAALHDRLLAARSTSHRIALLERFLLGLLDRNDRPMSGSVLMGLAMIGRARGALAIEEVCAAVGLSRKQFGQRFRDEIGVSPKRYARILRFTTVIEELPKRLTNDRAVDWAEVALDYGFYDQAHFIKDFRTFCGETPTDFLRSRSPDGRTIIYE